MSKIVFNSIQSKIAETPNSEFKYIGAIIKADSGYLIPKIVRSSDEIESIYGKFKWDHVYKRLVEDNIPVCLLPIITKASKYNKCSLQLNSVKEDSIISYSHPKKDRIYTSKEVNAPLYGDDVDDQVDRRGDVIYTLTKESADLIDNGKLTYGLVLDLSYSSLNDFTLETDNEWYIILNTQYQSISGVNQVISNKFILKNNIANGTIASFSTSTADNILFNYVTFSDVTGIDTGTSPSDFNEILNNFKTNWITRFSVQEGRSKETLRGLSSCKLLPDIISDFVLDYFKFNEGPDITSDGKQINVTDWIEQFIATSYNYDFYLLPNKDIEKLLRSALTELIIAEDFIDANSINTEIKSQYNSNNSGSKRYCTKILLTFRYPVSVDVLSTNDNIKCTNAFNYSNDRLCEFIEDSKVIDFYSKIKGPTGSNISIEVEKDSNFDELYDITIKNDITIENYKVYTTNTKADYILAEAVHISELGRLSTLVDVRFYDYLLHYPDGDEDLVSLIDSRYFDFQLNNIPYEDKYKRDQSEYILPIGSFTLKRVIDDPYDYSDICNTIEIYKKSEQYPDLFLVPDLEYPPEDSKLYKSDYLDRILDLVDHNTKDYSNQINSIVSQALINLYYTNLTDEFCRNFYYSGKYSKQYPDRNNRLLYFYGNSIINGKIYPAFFPYIYNLLNQDYLEYPAQSMLCDPFSMSRLNDMMITNSKGHKHPVKLQELTRSGDIYYVLLVDEVRYKWKGIISGNQIQIVSDFNSDAVLATYSIDTVKSWLDDKYVNYLLFDNLNYYWEKIKEPLGQTSVFMIRFIASKYAREIYKVRHRAVGVDRSTANSVIAVAINNATSYLSYVQNCEYNITFEQDKASVVLNITIPELTNKTLYLNIQLNV